MLTDKPESQSFDQRALETCAREPIHIPGAIQPHGALLSFSESGLQILQASENLSEHLPFSAEEALGKSIEQVFDADFAERVRALIRKGDSLAQSPLRVAVVRGGKTYMYDAIVHRSSAVGILELEPAEGTEGVSFPEFYGAVRDAIGLIQGSTTVEGACQVACEQIAKISGFGRVMAYRFDEDWHGRVVAESVLPTMVSYLGLHFPASDIPAQARRLYTVNWMRLIANRQYRPARLVPALNPATGQPLDMSHSVLRSVSPVHLEYLRNMGDCEASMSVSVVKGEQLWALIACHHPQPRHVPYQERVACEFIGRMLSHHVTTLEIQDVRVQRDEARARIATVMGNLDRKTSLLDGLAGRASELMQITGSQGAALLVRGELRLLGITPGEQEVRELLPKLIPSSSDQIFCTEHLERMHRPAADYKDRAAGALAITTTGAQSTMIVWFRPEWVRTVAWAGDPTKQVTETSGGTQIHPRQSFATWKETLRARSAPWGAVVQECALEFRNQLATEELARANAELALSNEELDNYGYIVSHDLKEPVRGIRNYISFLVQDHGKDLSLGVRSRLDQIVTLTRRMDELLDSLFHYSRVGRVALAREIVDLNDVLRRVLESLNFTVESEKVQVVVEKALPRMVCDRARIGEIFFNLILNGIKYNNRDRKQIEVGWREQKPAVFYVKDNGIGIAEIHRPMVFRMFKRLHARDKFGGGTGSGLAIVRRIVELHGGKIWIESQPGEGSTFFFTLERDDAGAQTE